MANKQTDDEIIDRTVSALNALLEKHPVAMNALFQVKVATPPAIGHLQPEYQYAGLPEKEEDIEHAYFLDVDAILEVILHEVLHGALYPAISKEFKGGKIVRFKRTGVP